MQPERGTERNEIKDGGQEDKTEKGVRRNRKD